LNREPQFGLAGAGLGIGDAQQNAMTAARNHHVVDLQARLLDRDPRHDATGEVDPKRTVERTERGRVDLGIGRGCEGELDADRIAERLAAEHRGEDPDRRRIRARHRPWRDGFRRQRHLPCHLLLAHQQQRLGPGRRREHEDRCQKPPRRPRRRDCLAHDTNAVHRQFLTG
jgi:hypothetical protein